MFRHMKEFTWLDWDRQVPEHLQVFVRLPEFRRVQAHACRGCSPKKLVKMFE